MAIPVIHSLATQYAQHQIMAVSYTHLAGMYVRGGNGDDNLYMIEGNPLYQINHVGGLFSSFNAEAVKDVEFLSLIHILFMMLPIYVFVK